MIHALGFGVLNVTVLVRVPAPCALVPCHIGAVVGDKKAEWKPTLHIDAHMLTAILVIKVTFLSNCTAPARTKIVIPRHD